MKKITICTLLSISLLCSSCLGSFSAFNNLKDWNQEVSDSKFVNNLLFWALNIVPVYGVFLVGDALIFNVVEFWSGSNPIAMDIDESETRIVEHEGNQFLLTATKNRLQIHVIEGPRKGDKLDLVYSPTHKEWSAVKPNGHIIKLTSFEQGFYVVHTPDEIIRLKNSISKAEGVAILENYKCDNELALYADLE